MSPKLIKSKLIPNIKFHVWNTMQVKNLGKGLIQTTSFCPIFWVPDSPMAQQFEVSILAGLRLGKCQVCYFPVLHYMVKIKKIWTSKKIAVIILKFEQCEINVSKWCRQIGNIRLLLLPRPVCLKTWDHYWICSFLYVVDNAMISTLLHWG